MTRFEYHDSKPVTLVRAVRPMFVRTSSSGLMDECFVLSNKLTPIDDQALGPLLHAAKLRHENDTTDSEEESPTGEEEEDQGIVSSKGLRKGELKMLQRMYGFGWLVAFAIIHGERLPITLPIALFRILKSFVPSAYPDIVSPIDTMDPSTLSKRGKRQVGFRGELSHTGITVDCQYQPTPIDFAEVAPHVLSRMPELVSLPWADLIQEMYALGIDRDTQDKDILVWCILAEGTMLGNGYRPYIRAMFLGLLDSGICSSVAWQQSTPQELRDMVSIPIDD